MSKVLFIAPPYHCWGVQVIGTWPPLQLAYLAGVAIEAGHDVRLCDAMNNGYTFDDVRSEIEGYRAGLRGDAGLPAGHGSHQHGDRTSRAQDSGVAKEVDPEHRHDHRWTAPDIPLRRDPRRC